VAAGAALVAAELKPSAFYALDALAAMHESLGDLDNAKRLYVESSRMMPAVSNHAWGTGRRLSRPLYRAILEGLEEGMERSPVFERRWLHLEIVRFAREQGDYETALAHAHEAAADAEGGYAAYISRWELYRTLEQLGRFDEALVALEDASNYHSDPQVLSRSLGMLEYRIGMWAEACVDLRQALRANNGNAALRGQTARACEQAGEVELARQLLRQGFAVPTEHPALARALLDFELRQGRYNVAEGLARSWAADFPDHPEFQRWADGLAGR
jgi:Flp pilus assembly protein TadD